MGKQSTLDSFYLQRLDHLMAIGESRHQAKQALREASEEKRRNLSTGKIHSQVTRQLYQQQVMAFVDWVETTHQVTDHRLVEAHADAWACQYLQALIEQGRSPYTLHTIRSALRMVFGREIASSVAMPRRKRSEIKRSRRPVKMDAHFQPEHWPEHILFAKATGLRRAEMREVRVRDITHLPDGTLSVHVHRGKAREVTVLAGYEQEVLAMLEGRTPDERLFRHIPKNMDVQSYRLASAQARYQQLAPGSTLPAADVARIKLGDYNAAAAQTVSKSLGHRNRATVLNHYLLE